MGHRGWTHALWSPVPPFAGAAEAARAIDALVAAGVLVETTGRRRDRTFAYSACLDRLKMGPELDVG